MSTIVNWSVRQLVCQKNAKKCKKWRIQPKSSNINCFNDGKDLKTFTIPVFFVCVSFCLFITKFLKECQKSSIVICSKYKVTKTYIQSLFLHSCKNEMYLSWLKYLGQHTIVIEYYQDSTMQGALHGSSHICLRFIR